MKFKQLAILSLALIITMGTTGCQPNNSNNQTSNIQLSDTHGALSETIKEMIHSKAELTNLVKVLTDGLPTAKSEDADSAVLLYVKYADSKSADLARQWIYSTPEISDKFTKVFTEDFQSKWDETKIASIDDKEIKSLFTNLNDALMKIDAYGEYLGPVVNYQKISTLPNISESLKSFYTNVNGLYTTGRLANQLMGLDYKATAEYAVKMEDVYNTTKDLTLKETASSMLTFALNLYYTGSEGSSPFDFEKKTLTSNFVTSTSEVIKKYGNYHVGKLGKAFLDLSEANNGQLTSDFADVVINYKKFGFDSKKSVKSNKVIKESDYFEITPVFSGFDSPGVEEKIASAVETAVGQLKENVQWEQTEKTNYHLSYIIGFANDRYFSMQMSAVSYNKENSTNLYDTTCLIFDSKSGAKITLKDIFKDDYDKNVKRIKELVLKDIIEQQKLSFKTTKEIVIEDSVLIDPNYLQVTLKKGSYSDEQQYNIVAYVLFSDLMDTFDMSAYLR